MANARSPILREVCLAVMRIGPTTWDKLTALAQDVEQPAADGVLSLISLKLKTAHFDFENSIMSWTR